MARKIKKVPWPPQTEQARTHIEGVDTCCLNHIPHENDYDPLPTPSRIRIFVADEFTYKQPKRGNCL
jgi:hypothetical protein